MKYYIVLIIFFSYNYHGLAQIIMIPDTSSLMNIEKYESLRFYGQIDDSKVRINYVPSDNQKQSKYGEKSFLYRDSLLSDSIEYSFFHSDVRIYDTPVLMGAARNSKTQKKYNYSVDLIAGKFQFIDSTNHFFSYSDGELYGGELNFPKYYEAYSWYVSEIVAYTLQGQAINPVYSFENDTETAEGIINILSFPKRSELLLGKASCYMDFSECDSAQMYGINLESKSIQPYESSRFELLDKFYLKESELYFIRKPKWHGGRSIINNQNRKITNVLSGRLDLVGWNYQNGQLTSHNFKSRTDEKPNWAPRFSEVIIPYRFTLRMERSLYRIYHNEIMLKEDTDKFDLYDLLILKNMVFAKHNYGFEKRFYQAFFNLFGFYGNDEKRKSRTKEVNHLLSVTDRNNLRIINAKLESYGN